MKLKICGMKHFNNIEEVAQLQPDYLGFIFYEKSPRYFNGQIPNLSNKTKKVGVFVNHTSSFVLEMVNRYELDLIQLHGNESPDYCRSLKQSVPNTSLIKVFSIKDSFDFNSIESYTTCCDFFLFDTKGTHPGGNGLTFDWSVLNNYPYSLPYFLSGGIGIEESTKLQQFLDQKEAEYCIAIDVNSKFETEPGLKNTDLLTRFIQKTQQL